MGDWDNMLTGVLAGMGALSQGVNAGLNRMHKTDLMRMAEEANKARFAAGVEEQKRRDAEQRAEQRNRDLLGMSEAMMHRAAKFNAGAPSSLSATPLAPNAPPVTSDVVKMLGVDVSPVRRVANDPTVTNELAARFNAAAEAYRAGNVTPMIQYNSDAAGWEANQRALSAEAERANTLAGQEAVRRWVAANPKASQPDIDSAVAWFTTLYGLPQGAIPPYDRAGSEKAKSEADLNTAKGAELYARTAEIKAKTPDVSKSWGWMQANKDYYESPEALARAAALQFNMSAVSDELVGAARGLYPLAQKDREAIEANKALQRENAQNQADLQAQKSRDALMQAISTSLVKNFNFDQKALAETMLMVRTLTSDDAGLIYASLGDRANGKPLDQIRADLRDARVNQQVIDTIFPIQAN